MSPVGSTLSLGVSPFNQRGYEVVAGLIPERAVSFLYEYVVRLGREGRLKRGDKAVPTALRGSGEPIMDALLEALRPRVEASTHATLDPTYAYFRLYGRGDVLAPHTDRPECEISVSLNLGGEPKTPWPLWVEADGQARGIELSPGDGLLYKGIELRHWREPFEGDHFVQVFLHYVDRGGPHRDRRFDGRRSLATSPTARYLVERLLAEP